VGTGPCPLPATGAGCDTGRMGDVLLAPGGRPAWAERMRSERAARGWSQADAVRALQAHAHMPLPATGSLLRNWKRWEAGEVEPDDFYKPLIAKTFGTVTAAFFPRRVTGREEVLLAETGMDTMELVNRLRASDVSRATLDGVAVTAERLACEYPYVPSEQLLVDGRDWLRQITGLLDGHLTLPQHREVLTQAGWVALVLGCVEYDMGMRTQSEATRKAALSLGDEAGNGDIIGWAHEMRAWYALTQGNYRGAIQAASAGQDAAPSHGVAVQLLAQRAKAWARVGDRRQVEVALDAGRRVLEGLPYPENLDNHFVVDPAKFDFYAMDCYRIVGEDQLAELAAHEVVTSSTDFDGTVRKPMRVAEAEITLGVLAARAGEPEQAVDYGRRALVGERKSLPSLLMVSRELADILSTRFPDAPATGEYLDELRSIAVA
jgi:tetratricopeptide (TPR) repeat protein